MSEPKKCLAVRKRSEDGFFTYGLKRTFNSMLGTGFLLATSMLWFLIFLSIPATAELAAMLLAFYWTYIPAVTVVGIILIIIAWLFLRRLNKKGE